jgi:hypothetical protein
MIFPTHKTKIVCTIGPASRSKALPERLMIQGMNVARLNFAHGTLQEHREDIQRIRTVAAGLRHLSEQEGPNMKEFDDQQDAPPLAEAAILKENRVHRILVRALLLVMVVEWIVLLIDQLWLSAFLVTLMIATLLSPVIFRKKLDVEIPAECHITAVVFIFASLYLGEIQDFYHRFWWWDIALHTSAGLLIGIVGNLLVYLLHESKRVELHMTPVFISLFAFSFAVTIGTLWDIFEFSMD